MIVYEYLIWRICIHNVKYTSSALSHWENWQNN